MGEHSTFIGLDMHKETTTVALAADSDEVGPVIQLEAGHCSETKPATVPT